MRVKFPSLCERRTPNTIFPISHLKKAIKSMGIFHNILWPLNSKCKGLCELKVRFPNPKQELMPTVEWKSSSFCNGMGKGGSLCMPEHCHSCADVKISSLYCMLCGMLYLVVTLSLLLKGIVHPQMETA